MNPNRESGSLSYDLLVIMKEMHEESNFAHPETSRFSTLKKENRPESLPDRKQP